MDVIDFTVPSSASLEPMADAEHTIEQKIPESLTEEQVQTIVASFESNGYRVVLESTALYGVVLRAYRRSAESIASEPEQTSTRNRKRRIVPTLVTEESDEDKASSDRRKIFRDAPEISVVEESDPSTLLLTMTSTGVRAPCIVPEGDFETTRFCIGCAKTKPLMQYIVHTKPSKAVNPKIRSSPRYCNTCEMCRAVKRIKKFNVITPDAFNAEVEHAMQEAQRTTPTA